MEVLLVDINNLQKFLDTVKSGRVALGCVSTLTDAAVTEIAAESGFDFCWIDGEHGILDRHTAQQHLMAVRGTDCASFYRVPSCDHTEIKKIIDLAPAGIIVPMIMNAEDAEKAVSACRYPPRGNRGVGYRRGFCYGSLAVEGYLELSKEDPLVILQIEHIEAVRNLDSILKVPGVGAALIGPYDLSMSINKPGMWDDPEVSSTIDMACEKILKSGVLLGAYAESDYSEWARRGVQFIGIKKTETCGIRGVHNGGVSARKLHCNVIVNGADFCCAFRHAAF
jgi:2-keto-3-deoxy-L-rhamnonate aldolase RhmA